MTPDTLTILVAIAAGLLSACPDASVLTLCDSAS